jgi:hypothetical protein
VGAARKKRSAPSARARAPSSDREGAARPPGPATSAAPTLPPSGL